MFLVASLLAKIRVAGPLRLVEHPLHAAPVTLAVNSSVTHWLSLFPSAAAASAIADWPYEPEDLRDDTGPVLIGCTLPRRQAER